MSFDSFIHGVESSADHAMHALQDKVAHALFNDSIGGQKPPASGAAAQKQAHSDATQGPQKNDHAPSNNKPHETHPATNEHHGWQNVASTFIGGMVDEAVHHPLHLAENFAAGVAIGAGVAVAVVAAPEVALVVGAVGAVATAGIAGYELARHGTEWKHDIDVVANPENYSSKDRDDANTAVKSFGSGFADFAANAAGGAIGGPATLLLKNSLSVLAQAAPVAIESLGSTAMSLESKLAAPLAKEARTALIPWVQNFDKPLLSEGNVAENFAHTMANVRNALRIGFERKSPEFVALGEKITSLETQFKTVLGDAGIDMTSLLGTKFNLGDIEYFEKTYSQMPEVVNRIKVIISDYSSSFDQLQQERISLDLQNRLKVVQTALTDHTEANSLPEVSFGVFAEESLPDVAGWNWAGVIKLVDSNLTTPSNETVNFLAHELTHAEQDSLIFRYLAEKTGIGSAPSAEDAYMLAQKFINMVPRASQRDLPAFSKFAAQVLAKSHGQPLTPTERFRAASSLEGTKNYEGEGPNYMTNFLEVEAFSVGDYIEQLVRGLK